MKDFFRKCGQIHAVYISRLALTRKKNKKKHVIYSLCAFIRIYNIGYLQIALNQYKNVIIS